MTATLTTRPPIVFDLPHDLEAHEPPEARGLARDDVRMLVSRPDIEPAHARFRDLPRILDPGDLLVINTSATLPASLDAVRPDGSVVELHLSTPLPAGLWVVELRRPATPGTLPFREDVTGETLCLVGGGRVELLARFPRSARLWVASLHLPVALPAYLAEHGRPIRYGHVDHDWPLSAYQTVYADEPGSAEMPSAGRAFTPELITSLVARGVGISPIVLHAGVGSLETGEMPTPEPFRVPAATAQRVNATRANGGRVVAVGTTVVRALETVGDAQGVAHPGEGWTELVITAERGVRVIDGLLTGWHEPAASHLLMLEAVAGRQMLDDAYRAALAGRYLWHEFGDLHLLLP
ncbi:MAG TPA: S-adenosylmethionine:tRNA ribosyltransferase-isomerase [Acidimicrobiales bacterium]|nr:S-adenosylmethionine:tRNA ribosyltransferase-isomerase [Acidimicrobiales bacterium]